MVRRERGFILKNSPEAQRRADGWRRRKIDKWKEVNEMPHLKKGDVFLSDKGKKVEFEGFTDRSRTIVRIKDALTGKSLRMKSLNFRKMYHLA